MTAPDPGSQHTETETHTWSVNVPDHAQRTDSPDYLAAKKKMNEIAAQAPGLLYGTGPFQDHHGSALWLKDEQGWFMVRNLAGIEWSAQFCVSGAVKVLTADLRWIPAAQVYVGQHLLGFDEESGPGLWRRWRTAKVLAATEVCLPCYDLEFSDGTTVRASADHRWLVGHGGAHGNSAWLETSKLRVAGKFSSKVLRLTDVWEEDTSRGGGYLAAAYDGEGSLSQTQDEERGRGFGTSVRLQFAQRSNAMLSEVEKLLAERGFEFRKNLPADGCYRLVTSSRADIMRLLGSIRPHRLLESFRADALGTMQRIGVAELTRKEFVGVQPVISLMTSTGTFVAEGLASHNCADPAKVDLLRQNAKRLYDLLAPEIKQELDPHGLLDTPITDADGIAKWTDSIFNAGVPLDPGFHIGVMPMGKAQAQNPPATAAAPSSPDASDQAQAAAVPGDPEPAGVHHYPTPIVDIQLFKRDDFQLWVTDSEGNPAAVTPVAPRGSGVASVHVQYATPGSQLAQQKQQQEGAGGALILPPDHPLAQQAFQNQ